MTITLTIESVDSLPDGGPITYKARNRGFQIGRQQHLDWTLPDPSRHISGLHCEVRFEKGGYWLYDVSSNGTFLNGSSSRMKSPYRLVDGDRLAIGQYVISVAVDDVGAVAPGPAEGAPDYQQPEVFSSPSDDIWGTGEPAPPPIDRRELTPQSAGRRAPDFSQQFLEFPDMTPAAPPPRPASPFDLPGGPAYQPQPDALPPRPDALPEPAPRFAPPGASFPAAGESPFSFRPEPLPPRQDPAPTPPPRFAPEASPFQPPEPAVAWDRAQPVPDAPAAAPNPFAAPRPAPGFGDQAGIAARQSAPQPIPVPQSGAPVQPVPAARPLPSARSASAGDDQALGRFMQALAAGAGVSPDAFATRDPAELGYEIGESLKVCVEQLAQLLRARAAAKAMTRSGSRTMIGSADNNPLKFIPGTAEAIDVMYSRRRPGFLGGKASLEAGFADLKKHELATYAAMQKALARLLEELSPETISEKVGSATFSKKSRSWELFVERWEEKTSAHENGMLDVFFAYFSEAYDAASKKG